jgi:uncharacterized Tic20 family protein
MIEEKPFAYVPVDHESEKASNSYLMSLIALIAGLPLPIINLIATFIFYMGNLKGTYFVRWHCTQALMSQVTVLFINSAAFYWTLHIIFGKGTLTNHYIAYVLTVLIFNLIEFIMTIYAAVQTRKGIHVEWWFWGPLTNLICKN